MRIVLRILLLLCCSSLVATTLHAEEATSTPQDETTQVKSILTQAASQAVQLASEKEAYWSHENIRIPFPSDLSDVETQMSQAGKETAAQVNEALKLMNATADEAAKNVLPLLQEAINDLKIEDAASILQGDAPAATNYFKKANKSLKYSYKPIVKEAMAEVGMEKVWEPLLVMYGDLPENDSVVDQNAPENVPEGFDLAFYISDRGMEGLFKLMAEQEGKIRAKK